MTAGAARRDASVRAAVGAALLGAALLFSASAARAQAFEGGAPPCDPALPAVARGECLKARVDASERALAAERARIDAAIEAAPGLFPPQRVRWRRALDDTQGMWVRLRNAECQEVAPFEEALARPGGAPPSGEPDRAPPADAAPATGPLRREAVPLGPRRGDLYLARLICLAERNAARLAELRRRYPEPR